MRRKQPAIMQPHVSNGVVDTSSTPCSKTWQTPLACSRRGTCTHTTLCQERTPGPSHTLRPCYDPLFGVLLMQCCCPMRSTECMSPHNQSLCSMLHLLIHHDQQNRKVATTKLMITAGTPTVHTRHKLLTLSKAHLLAMAHSSECSSSSAAAQGASQMEQRTMNGAGWACGCTAPVI